ncbi:MAG TPA: response regulator transcription factor [Steroidobacteraceae bacterium]|nr:response regulator transcription factor [Steroidobacteraceae bacterium]
MPATRIAVVDDHQLVRIGLKQIIESQADFSWAGEARTGREALALLGRAPVDVLLLDLSLPDMSGLDVLRQVRSHHESVATLVLSAYPEMQYGLNVLRAGASGFISKTADDAELCRAIRAAVRGGRYVSPELAEVLVSGIHGAPGEPRHSVLSEREFQIFCKLAEGKSVSEIAAKLFLSVKTVSTYRTRILEKMGMKTNADITYYAIKNDLLQ